MCLCNFLGAEFPEVLDQFLEESVVLPVIDQDLLYEFTYLLVERVIGQ